MLLEAPVEEIYLGEKITSNEYLINNYLDEYLMSCYTWRGKLYLEVSL